MNNGSRHFLANRLYESLGKVWHETYYSSPNHVGVVGELNATRIDLQIQQIGLGLQDVKSICCHAELE